ncbi:MAG: hypothetical protein HS126_05240 [Anaerolineales bacterium]|nr:hypothetical protein [Anaerolineales bacterium]
MNGNLEGSKIMDLLSDGLDRGLSLVRYVRDLYIAAEERILDDPQRAIEICRDGLNALEKGPSSDSSDLDAPRYSKGKFHLLLASIYLNEDRGLQLAEENYHESKNEFGSRKWFQLEALAYLGLAISRQKLRDLDGAISACNSAMSSVNQEGMPENIDPADLIKLRRAIENENARILRLIVEGQHRLTIEPPPPPILEVPLKELHEGIISSLPVEEIQADYDTEEAASVVETPPTEKILPIFNISAVEGLIKTSEESSLNLISREDYEQKVAGIFEKVVIDLTELTERSRIQYVDYILEIGEGLRLNDNLKQRIWLPIQQKTAPKDLDGKMVIVLEKEADEISASLKTFVKADDHFFLKSRNKNSASIILLHYKSNLQKIKNYYTALHEENVVGKRVDEVQITGALYYNQPILPESIEAVKAFIWQVPVVNDISAGQGHSIEEDKIRDYVELRENNRRDADYFVVVVKEDSMIGDGIFPGSYALIRQQEKVINKSIAAIIYKTPKTKPRSVLKRYYVINEKVNHLQHWLLESSNPSSKHFVMIPNGADVKEIKNFYAKRKLSNRIIFYENAELKIVGKFIKTVERN